jgi:hypothetical protein
MKKILQILLLSIVLTGCASLVLEPVSSSQEETQRILALDLTHAENLIEASKLNDNHTISVVTGQLNKARDEKIQAEVDLVESIKFSEMVVVSDNYSNFTGSKISESIKKGVLMTDVDFQEYYLSGVKDTNSGLLKHQLHLTIKYNSNDKRIYSSANLCDEWNRCSLDQRDVVLISSIASNCTTSASLTVGRGGSQLFGQKGYTGAYLPPCCLTHHLFQRRTDSRTKLAFTKAT